MPGLAQARLAKCGHKGSHATFAGDRAGSGLYVIRNPEECQRRPDPRSRYSAAADSQIFLFRTGGGFLCPDEGWS